MRSGTAIARARDRWRNDTFPPPLAAEVASAAKRERGGEESKSPGELAGALSHGQCEAAQRLGENAMSQAEPEPSVFFAKKPSLTNLPSGVNTCRRSLARSHT